MKSRIQKYLETAKGATPGPWNNTPMLTVTTDAASLEFHGIPVMIQHGGHNRALTSPDCDCEFIAASRTEGPWCAEMLLKAIEILKDYERYGYTDIPTFLGELEK